MLMLAIADAFLLVTLVQMATTLADHCITLDCIILTL